MERLHRQHLSARLCQVVDPAQLQHLSRIPPSRLERTALPNIGLVELVSAEIFQEHYSALYVSMFHGGERENADLIIERLRDDFAGVRVGLQPYRIVGIRDRSGQAIAAAHFSVLMLDGGKYAVPYLQYIYVRAENRRQDLSEVLHAMVLAVATADAKSAGDGRMVPFTLFETEPPGHGTSAHGREKATERTAIHAKSGSRAVMLENTRQSCSPGRENIISAHVQPGLERGHSPLTLVWAIRPSPHVAEMYDVDAISPALLAAYYRSLRDEGFPEENIVLAEGMAAMRRRGRKFVEVPLAAVSPDMCHDQGVIHVEEPSYPDMG